MSVFVLGGLWSAAEQPCHNTRTAIDQRRNATRNQISELQQKSLFRAEVVENQKSYRWEQSLHCHRDGCVASTQGPSHLRHTPTEVLLPVRPVQRWTPGDVKFAQCFHVVDFGFAAPRLGASCISRDTKEVWNLLQCCLERSAAKGVTLDEHSQHDAHSSVARNTVCSRRFVGSSFCQSRKIGTRPQHPAPDVEVSLKALNERTC